MPTVCLEELSKYSNNDIGVIPSASSRFSWWSSHIMRVRLSREYCFHGIMGKPRCAWRRLHSPPYFVSMHIGEGNWPTYDDFQMKHLARCSWVGQWVGGQQTLALLRCPKTRQCGIWVLFSSWTSERISLCRWTVCLIIKVSQCYGTSECRGHYTHSVMLCLLCQRCSYEHISLYMCRRNKSKVP